MSSYECNISLITICYMKNFMSCIALKEHDSMLLLPPTLTYEKI